MNHINKLVEVTLPNDESFLKVKETLTRIGVASSKEKKLFQSCHILHKQGKYYITHFKEMFLLDGKVNNFSEDDEQRRNTIILLLDEWGILTVVDRVPIANNKAAVSHIKIISHSEKKDWELMAKYNIGH